MASPVTSRIERELFFRMFARTARPPDAVVRQFVESLVEERPPRGAVLFRAGEPGDFLYNVMSGAVELRDPSGRTAPWTFGPRSTIGVLDAIQGQPYSRTAVVLEDAVVLRLRFEDYFEILEDNFEFTKFMLGFVYRGVEEFSRALPAGAVYPGDPDVALPPAGPDLVQRVLVLRAAAPFRNIRLQVLVRLAEGAALRRLEAGEPLFEPGQGSDALWFVVRGAIFGRRDDPPLDARFGRGTMLLPLAAFAGLENGYRAVAAEPSLLLALRKEDLWDVLEDHSDVTRVLMAHAAHERARLQTLSADLAARGDGRTVMSPSDSRTFKEHLLSMPDGGDDTDFAARRGPGRPVDS